MSGLRQVIQCSAKIGTALSVTIGVAAMVHRHENAMTERTKAGQTLAAELGELVSSDADFTADTDVGTVVNRWGTSHVDVISVDLRLVEGGDRTLYSASSENVRGAISLELSVMRNREAWGTVKLTMRGADDPLSAIAVLLQVYPGRAAAVGIGLGAGWLAWALRKKGRGVGGVWSSARERAQSTLDFLTEGVVVTDKNGVIVFANKPMRALLNDEQLSIGRTNIRQLPWGGGVSSDTLVEGESRPASLICSDGAERFFMAGCLAVGKGHGALGTLVTFNDVTELENSRVALQSARDAADQANLAKSSFLANMSHEIRTPINGVMGTLELLDDTPLAQGQRRYVDAARSSASTLLHLINDVLDVSKIDAGKLELDDHDVDLEEFITSGLAVVSQAAAAKGLMLSLRINSDVPLWIRGDGPRLRQIILNLAANAVKFTERGQVRVDVSTKGEQHICFEITDTGIGIPPDRVHRLFQVFSQVDASTSRKYGGSGLGLSISKQLSELMGGAIGVESNLGEGSIFRVSIPLRAVAKSPTRQPASFAGMKCLVVDRHADNRESLRLLATRAGLVVIAAVESIEAASNEYNIAGRPSGIVAIVGCVRWEEEQSCVARALRDELGSTCKIIGASVSEPTPQNERQEAGVVNGWLHTPASLRSLSMCLNGSKGAGSLNNHQVDTMNQTHARGRVLIAEDHQVSQMITREIVTRAGWEAQVVDSGPAAYEAALSGEFALILMDCHLPGCDGYEVARKLREWEVAHPNEPHRRIIALTASAMSGDRDKCLAAGMDSYVTKPVSRQALLAAMDEQDAMRAAKPHESNVEEPCGHGPAKAINFKELEERCLSHLELMQELLASFESTTVVDLEALERAVNHSQTSAASGLAHRIAGAAMQVGAHQLGQLAKQCEASASSINPLQLSQVRSEFAKCQDAIRRWTPAA